jgi:hypothetical protein
MKMKGFVGPLGDDIPSIFPIIAGILLFMATFFYAFQAIDAKNKFLEQRKATLGLAYIITEKGFVSEDEFGKKCENLLKPYAETHGTKFAVTVKKFCSQINLNANIFNEKTTLSEDPQTCDSGSKCSEAVGMICMNADQEISEVKNVDAIYSPDEYAQKAPKNMVVLNYPVAVQDPCETGSMLKGLGLISVIAWR